MAKLYTLKVIKKANYKVGFFYSIRETSSAVYVSRRARRKILPTLVFGNSFLNSTNLGTL